MNNFPDRESNGGRSKNVNLEIKLLPFPKGGWEGFSTRIAANPPPSPFFKGGELHLSNFEIRIKKRPIAVIASQSVLAKQSRIFMVQSWINIISSTYQSRITSEKVRTDSTNEP